MIISEVEAVTQQHGRPMNALANTEEDFRISKGDFVGVVHARERKYGFFVRDMRREKPTIHGVGVDFTHAVTAVTQLLDALASAS